MKYSKEIKTELNNLHEVQAFRHDERYAVNTGVHLALHHLCLRHKILRLFKGKRDVKTKWQKYKFDSCSYDELTNCIRGRIRDIRNYRNVLSTGLEKYPYVKQKILKSLEIDLFEIKKLLRYRRVLKRSGCRNLYEYQMEMRCQK